MDAFPETQLKRRQLCFHAKYTYMHACKPDIVPNVQGTLAPEMGDGGDVILLSWKIWWTLTTFHSFVTRVLLEVKTKTCKWRFSGLQWITMLCSINVFFSLLYRGQKVQSSCLVVWLLFGTFICQAGDVSWTILLGEYRATVFHLRCGHHLILWVLAPLHGCILATRGKGVSSAMLLQESR